MSPSFAADTIQDETNETLMPKGMWKDPKTNLIWMRCSYGESFVNGTCSGSAKLLTWEDAITLNGKKYEDLNGWRLPTMEELHGIIDCGNGLLSDFVDKQEFYDNNGILRSFATYCKGKKHLDDAMALTLNNNIFPEKKIGYDQYGSGMSWTIYANPMGDGYGYINFIRGTFSEQDKYVHYAVRLVKGGDIGAYLTALPHVQMRLFEEKNSIMQKSEAYLALVSQQKRKFSEAESLRLLNGRNGDPTKYSTPKENIQCKFFDGFIINGDGTATDPRNNLTWKRCPEGSKWENSYCSAGTEPMDWSSAMFAAKNSNFLNKNDWRLPTIDELKSIAGSYKDGCINNKRNANAVSPVLASQLNLIGAVGEYWSTTKSKTQPLKVLGLTFNTGYEFSISNNIQKEVRLVRSDSITSKQEFDNEYGALENSRLKTKMAEPDFGNSLTLENFFTSSEYSTVLKNFTPTVESFKNAETFGVKVIYPNKTFEFTKVASCKSNGTSTKQGGVGYFEGWLGSVKSRTLTYDNLICHGNSQDFVKFEQKLTGQSIVSHAFDSTWSVEKLTKNEVERYENNTPSSFHKYTSYKVVSMYDDKAYVRCLPDSSYTKEEVLWRRDSGKYAATGWFDSLPFDKAARLVCNIDD